MKVSIYGHIYKKFIQLLKITCTENKLTEVVQVYKKINKDVDYF